MAEQEYKHSFSPNFVLLTTFECKYYYWTTVIHSTSYNVPVTPIGLQIKKQARQRQEKTLIL